MIIGIVVDMLERKAIAKRLRNVVRHSQFSAVFQPIVDVNSMRPVGFEALTRFHVEPYRPPNEWFSDAKRVGVYSELEFSVHQKAVEQIALLPTDTYVSVNVTEGSLLKREVCALAFGINPARVVLELSEQEIVADYEAVKNALKPLRQMGVRLAVDDAGAGYASFWHILKLEPEIIKIDAKFVQNVDKHSAQKKFVGSMLDYANHVGSIVVAEGVETEEELSTLKDIGINYVQGYLCGKPRPVVDVLMTI